MNDLIRMTAREAVRCLKNKDVSPHELIDAALSRIAKVEPSVNALPTLCEDRARDFAANLSGNPDQPGWLAGLPVAIKDMNEVGGVRTTYGSPIYADHVPEKSDITVTAMEALGATVLAKSNTPEFAAGANTFNEVFGKTRNPWNTALTCGGSSGGSAVALATGEVWLAGGSDLGGSLRTPAAFCSVVGYRPSPGRVRRANVNPFDTMGVNGPMARNVGDVGLLLDNMAGEDMADPISLPVPDVPYQASAESPRPPKRIAFTRDFGFLPVAAEIKEIVAGAASRLEELGAEVVETHPDLKDGPEIFQTVRAAAYAAGMAELIEQHRDLIKPEIIWNAEKGLALSPEEIARATVARGALYQRTVSFFDDFDLLVAPMTQVSPFDVDIRYVTEIEGTGLETYIDWIALPSIVTLTACPALSLPCGFTGDGLPVGLQLIASPRRDADLLSMAAAVEQLFGLAGQVPIDPR